MTTSSTATVDYARTSSVRALAFTPEAVKQHLQQYQVAITDGDASVMIYAIYDRRLGEFAPPSVSHSGFIIARGLAEMVKANPGSPIAAFPDDFILYCLGAYNVSIGVIVPYSYPQPLGTIRAIIQAVTPADLTAFLASVEALVAPAPQPAQK